MTTPSPVTVSHSHYLEPTQVTERLSDHSWIKDGMIVAGRYELIRRIGRGGMGDVFEARALSHVGDPRHRLVIKVPLARFRTHQRILRDFHLEGNNQTRLNHPNITRVYEVDWWEPSGAPADTRIPYIVQEHLDGLLLDDYCLLHGRHIPLGDLAQIFDQVAAALDEIHGKDLIHRDIKPQNIMICPGDPRRTDQTAKLLDFGLAVHEAFTEEFVSRRQAFMVETPLLEGDDDIGGTHPFMAPEMWQMTGAGPTSDIYGLAVTIYRTLTGAYPFAAVTPDDFRRAHEKTPPQPPSYFNPEISPELDAILLWALSKNPGMRPRSASEFTQRFRQAVANAGMSATMYDSFMRARSRRDCDSGEYSIKSNLPVSACSDVRWSLEDLRCLRRSTLFCGLSRSDILTILHAGALEEIRENTILFEKGDPADRMYAILTGEVEVFLPPEPSHPTEMVLARCGPGSVFGEIGLLLDQRRLASVRTRTEVRALAIGKGEFDLLVGRPHRATTTLLLNIAKSVCRTLESTDKKVRDIGRDYEEKIAELLQRVGELPE